MDKIRLMLFKRNFLTLLLTMKSYSAEKVTLINEVGLKESEQIIIIKPVGGSFSSVTNFGGTATQVKAPIV